MIRNILLVVVTVSVFHKCRANVAEDWEIKGKTTASLDFAIQLIKTVRDNYPSCSSKWLPMDCEDILENVQDKSSIYEVWPRSRVIKGPVKVYCDMETDGGGWTVIQRRGDYNRAKDFFYRDWKSYKEGFGNVDEDFWLGNDNIYALSNQRLYSVRFDLMDVGKTERYALYDNFWIDDEEHKYTLHIEGYSGDAGDSMTEVHSGQKFSTKDQDNDNQVVFACAKKYKGGWWYNGCHTANLNGLFRSANLNGLYHKGKHSSYADGVNWHAWKTYCYESLKILDFVFHNNILLFLKNYFECYESLETTEIKIRSKDFWKKSK